MKRFTPNFFRLSAAMLLGVGSTALVACEPSDSNASDAQSRHGSESAEHAAGGAEVEHAELAVYMTRMQRYAEKLGYSVQARNEPLASFYIHELEELGERISDEIPIYEGIEISRLLGALWTPSIEPLEQALAAGDWTQADDRYRTMINNCNSCHASSDHGFIVVAVPDGAPPFSQRFEPIESGGQ